MQRRIVGVWWTDLHAYDGAGRHEPTAAYTEGELIPTRSAYLVIRNPETLVWNPLRNHPQKRPLFYCIPWTLVVSVVPATNFHAQKKA